MLLDELEKVAAPIADVITEGPQVGFLEAILFLRLAEQHGLERFGALGDLAGAQRVGPELARHFDDAADRYGVNGLRVAASGRGQGRNPFAAAPEALLRDFLLHLYSDADGHELATLPPDTLGHLYERSLAKEGARGSRKVHGAFYTPTYLVDYVVERTLGRVLDGSARNAPTRVRVLDPACGSGAFLLGAYRRLLAWHFGGQGDERQPSAADRAAILENGIFGVDVDAAAVEVAKLSLLLVCCADGNQHRHSPEQGAHPTLPRLERNLRAGHSLIDTDWSDAETARGKTKTEGGAPQTGPEGARPFHWQREFPEVFAEGGFDVVIGNPPYLSFGGRHAVDISGELRRYYAAHYESGGWPTAHSLFLERSVKLLSRRFVSFVVPDQVGHLGGYRSAREIAQREAGLVEVRYWGERVFRGVTTPALTIVLDKQNKSRTTQLVDRDGASLQAVFRPGEPWSVSPAAALIERLRLHSFSLGKLVGDCGIRTTAAKEQVVDWPCPDGNIVPVLEGKLIDRYGCRPPRVAVRFDSPCPLFVSDPERYRAAIFVIRQTAAFPIVGPHEHALYFRNSLLALFSPSGGIDVHYLVALLNSKLLRFVYTETVREAHQRAFPQVKIKALQSLPLRKPDLARARDKRRHDALVDLAVDALAAQRSAALTSESESARSRFEAIDRKIDDRVYDLYELSQAERDGVEGSFVRAQPAAVERPARADRSRRHRDRRFE